MNKSIIIGIGCACLMCQAFMPGEVCKSGTGQLNGAISQTGKTVLLKYGDFDSWITRNVKESSIIGGHTKQLYEIAPTAVWNENRPYVNQGGSPWATSNVMAKVCGITKTNTSVYREPRDSGFCARLETHIEKCVVLGVVNIKVLAAGSIYLGNTLEPITGTSNPQGKLNSGVAFTGKPEALCFDYKVKLSGEQHRIRQTGFSKVTQVEGIDMADCLLYLQKRWEDKEGNLYAKRVGTMVVRFDKSTSRWVNDAQFPIHYGDITREPFFRSYMGLLSGEDTKYARNSKGEMVPVKEVGWGSEQDEPTHLLLQFDSSHGGAYIGSIGNTLWIDNVRLVY